LTVIARFEPTFEIEARHLLPGRGSILRVGATATEVETRRLAGVERPLRHFEPDAGIVFYSDRH